ncbi:hypothetical protein [Parasitella parasitica]|uniref:YncI copper-binding domain-containing protein n=1 Tax=Parasitella parasitica TaxID=35722 RepID=A0A0B7NKA2_9FUNG|nr:hypothetical protein [Parasitella parasitica]
MAIIRSSLIVSTLALFFYASCTDAHVSLTPKFAEPGQNLTTAFHIPHGCNGSATTGIFVTVPDAITLLTPQQVNNWTLTTTYRDESNQSISTISWFGGVLAPKDSLDFPMTLSLPNSDLSTQSNVTLYFPVVQTCQVGTANWTALGNDKEGEPAPTLVIVKNATQAAADAIAIKNNATTSTTSSSAAASQASSVASSIYAGALPFAAVIGTLAIAL